MAADQEPTPGITHRQRITELRVGRAKLSFEIRGPDRVGFRHRGCLIARMAHGPAPAARDDQAGAFQNVVGGTDGRQRPRGLALGQHGEDFLAAPRRMASAQRLDGRDDPIIGRLRAVPRARRSARQPGSTGRFLFMFVNDPARLILEHFKCSLFK